MKKRRKEITKLVEVVDIGIIFLLIQFFWNAYLIWVENLKKTVSGDVIFPFLMRLGVGVGKLFFSSPVKNVIILVALIGFLVSLWKRRVQNKWEIISICSRYICIFILSWIAFLITNLMFISQSTLKMLYLR